MDGHANLRLNPEDFGSLLLRDFLNSVLPFKDESEFISSLEYISAEQVGINEPLRQAWRRLARLGVV